MKPTLEPSPTQSLNGLIKQAFSVLKAQSKQLPESEHVSVLLAPPLHQEQISFLVML